MYSEGKTIVTATQRQKFREELKRKIQSRIESQRFADELRQITRDYYAAVKYIDKKFPEHKTISLRDML